LKKILRFFDGYRKESVLAPLFKMLEAIFELLVPLTVATIIDVGIRQKNTQTIYLMCGIMVALGVIGLICAICAQYFAAKAAVGVSAKIRSSLFSHIQGFDYATTDRIGTSTLITRMTNDIQSVQTGINMFLRLFMRSPFIVFGAMIMAFTINVRLALIFAITIPLLALVIFGIMLISIPIYKKSQTHLDPVVGKLRENYNGTRVIRAFNKESDETAAFQEKHRALTKIQLFAGRISALMNPLTYVIINLAVIFLIQFGALSVDDGTISQGELIALYNYMSQILVELIKLANLIITLNKASASAHRISDIFDTPSRSFSAVQAASVLNPAEIAFQEVSFRYHPTGDDAVSNVSFSIHAGQTVGIIGGTGSGKSTLIHLLQGLYSPTSGKITVDGNELNSYSQEQLRAMFGIVPQKAVLFKGTVRSNLQWGCDTANEEEMWHALELAQAKEFVEKAEHGLDSPVQQFGRNFSGGQKQRLTIARALLKHPKLLILDDSASALDYGTEAQLRQSLSTLSDTTKIIVSQRASSMLHADLILVLDDGILVGQGNHSELMERCETYREIYFSQFPKGGTNE